MSTRQISDPAKEGGQLDEAILAVIQRRRTRWLRSLSDPFLLFSVAVILAVTVMAIFANWLSPGDALDMVASPLLRPGEDPAFLLGTDSLGRNLTAGIVHGSRVSLSVGVLAAALAVVIGATVGMLSGYLGGMVDSVLLRITELFQTIPSMLLIIVILAVSDPSVTLIIVAIGISSWPMIARLTRAEFMALRQADFVMAAKGLGYSQTRIILDEILPNALPSVVVGASMLVANAILTEAGLSFLNLGDPNLVSWGSLIGNGRSHLRTEWYLSALPGLAIVLTVLSINIIGDRITDLMSPRARDR